jgi:hypothetical protein
MARSRSSLLLPAASIALVLPCAVFAAGNNNKPASKPRADQPKKVWTNADIPNLPPINLVSVSHPGANRGQTPTHTAALTPATDPNLYASQLSALQQELADVTSREEALRNFRATGSGLPTGLNVAAPCEGVGTDNLIAQLEIQRQQLEEQIDALDSTAKTNGVSATSIDEAAVAASIPSREELVAEYDSLSAQLNQTQSTITDMYAEAQAKGFTIAPPRAGEGGNLTTNRVTDLQNQAEALEAQMSALEDSLR